MELFELCGTLRNYLELYEFLLHFMALMELYGTFSNYREF